MDFELSHETEAVAELATRILTERSTSDRLAELESGDDWVDRRTLKELADAGILGIALPEDVGGGGLGWLELHHVLEQVGATVAHVPLWETVVLGALPVARHGTGEQRRRLLPGVVAGERLLTGALVEPGPVDPRAPETRAPREGDGWRLHGTKTQVPLAREADRILVSATTDDGHTGLFLVSPEQDGVELEDQRTVSGQPHACLTLTGAPVRGDDVVGEVGAGSPLADVLLHAEAGLASIQSGVCATALKMSAEYTSEREQFGRPIASFQAVAQRVADGYIDAEAVRLTSLHAAWRLAEGLDAVSAVAHREVVGRRRRAPGAARRPARPRRGGPRRRVPAASLLQAGQADRVHARSRHRAPAAHRP
jgi:3-oxocholest-4-en-26-oyl-CoA dehydrogenase beta subunit